MTVLNDHQISNPENKYMYMMKFDPQHGSFIVLFYFMCNFLLTSIYNIWGLMIHVQTYQEAAGGCATLVVYIIVYFIKR